MRESKNKPNVVPEKSYSEERGEGGDGLGVRIM